MEIPLSAPLVTLTDIIEGVPANIEVRQEIVDNETISHIALIQDGKETQLYDMKLPTVRAKKNLIGSF